MGDKGGARLDYGRKFTFWSGDTLESFEPEYDIPNMYLCEDEAFFESCTTGVKNRSHIDNILDSMLLLDTLYQSADRGEEIRLYNRFLNYLFTSSTLYGGKYYGLFSYWRYR